MLSVYLFPTLSPSLTYVGTAGGSSQAGNSGQLA